MIDPNDLGRFPVEGEGVLTRYDSEETKRAAVDLAQGSYQRGIVQGRLQASHAAGSYKRGFTALLDRLLTAGILSDWTVVRGMPVLVLSHQHSLLLAKRIKTRGEGVAA